MNIRKSENGIIECLSLENYKSIIEDTDSAIIAKTLDCTVLSWNRGAELLFGYTASEMLGQSILRIFPPDRIEEERTIMERIRRGERIRNFMTVRRHKNGHLIPIAIALSPLYDENGIIVGVSKVAREVTREIKLATLERQYEAIIQSSYDGIIGKDLNGIINFWNPAAERILGFTAKEIIGKSIRSIIPPELQNEETDIINRLECGERIEGLHTKRYHKNGKLIDVAITVSPIRDETGLIIGASKILRDITERRQQEEQTQRLLAEKETILSNAVVGIAYFKYGRIVACNKRFEEMFHYEPGDLIGQSSEVLYDSRETFEHIGAVAYNTTSINGGFTVEVKLRHKDGSVFWGTLSGKPLDPTHPHEGSIWVYSDINERKLAEEALRENQAHLDLALRSASMGVWQLDIAGNKQHFDIQQCLLLGINSATFKGSEEEFFRIIHPDDREAVRVKLARTIEQDVPYESEFRAVWPDGGIHYIAARGRLVRDNHGRPWRINGINFEITEWKEAQEKIHNLAFYDPLTGLPNRRLLTDRLHQAIVSGARNGLVGAILFIDLDNFKTINDTLGHACGDLLLQQSATRLRSCVREEDTVARIGGDEFVVMLECLCEDEPEAATQTKSIGMKILSALSQPYHIASHKCRSTCSIGITLFNDRSQSTDELLKQADITMYQAKKAGRNTLRFFDTQMQEIVTARATLEAELRNALETQQLQLYYQIQVDEWRNLIGAEALIRWVHPERGLVSPIEFIPLAEETGLILSIGQWVLESACAQLKAWKQEEPTRGLVLAVNISAKEFLQADFVAHVQTTIQRYAIDPKLLKLELTESLLLENLKDTVLIMNALKDIGIQFSLDDFGTGYSSLQYLKQLPLGQIKIDQSFVRELTENSSDEAIVHTIIAMAKSLNLDVIAEGVETEEQLQLLLNKGCTYYQGYLFGKPVPIEQFDSLLRQG